MTRNITPADLYRTHVHHSRQRFARYLNALPGPEEPGATFLDQLARQVFVSAIEDLDAILAGRCPELPARLAGTQVGQYHCPRCACMVVAGVAAHPHDDGCLLGLNVMNPEDPRIRPLTAAGYEVGQMLAAAPPDASEVAGPPYPPLPILDLWRRRD